MKSPMSGVVAVTGVAVLLAGGSVAPARAGDRSPAQVPVSDCWPTDNGDPVLTGLALSSTQLDLRHGRQQLMVRVTVEDTGGPGPLTGIHDVAIGWARNPRYIGNQMPVRHTSGNVWTGTLTLHPGEVRTGPAAVSAVFLTDWAGNHRDYRHDELAAMGFALGFDITAPAVDSQRPQLRELTITPAVVDVRRRSETVTLSAHLTDVGTGVRWAEAWFGGASEFEGPLRLVRGTRHDGVWRVTMRIPRWQYSSRYRLELDYADRRNGFQWPGKLGPGRWPDGFRLIGEVETDAPVLTQTHVTPSSLDLRASGGRVTVSVVATDATSGLHEVNARLISPHNATYSTTVLLHRVAGTAWRGRWTGTIPMPRCTSPGGRWTLWLNSYDRSGNAGNAVHGVAVDVTALDHIRPTVEVEGPAFTTAPVTFTFSEDVTNVDPANMQIQKLVQDQVTGAVAGTWLCRDVRHAEVDCATGLLRTASFTPSDPWVLDSDYNADLAPNGTVGVRDKAGNPVDGSSTPYFRPPEAA